MVSDTVVAMEHIAVHAIGWVRGGRASAEDDAWGAVTSRIELDPEQFDSDAVTGLDAFSHLEVIFVFDRVDPESICIGARHPRGRKDWPRVGIFAQRAKDRPNRIGLTVCEIVSVTGASIEVRGLDAVDGTPVLDVKPFMPGFAPRTEVRQPAWSDELMQGYW